jgi:hypothetical protein
VTQHRAWAAAAPRDAELLLYRSDLERCATRQEACISQIRCVVDAAVDGPGSLLNYQGHPVERLTPDRGVTNRDTDADHIVPESLTGKTGRRTSIHFRRA